MLRHPIWLKQYPFPEFVFIDQEIEKDPDFGRGLFLEGKGDW
jgi:hypothetical protein